MEHFQKKGILYDTGEIGKSHFLLTTLLGAKTRSQAPKQKESARKTIDLMRSAAANHDTVILSAETFFPASPDSVIALMSEIGEIEDPIKVIAYVRSPCSMYRSLVQQHLKGSSVFNYPNTYRRRIDLYISKWQAAVGQENMTVRLFERSKLIGNNVVSDFAEYLANTIGYDDGLAVVTANTSITAEQMIILQQLRRLLPVEAEGKFHKKSDELLRLFHNMNLDAPVGTPIRLNIDAEIAVHHGNKSIVKSVNTLLPGFSMTTGISTSKTEFTDRWSANGDVASILESFDPQILEHMRGVVFEQIN